jgi:hypothetical protein
MATYPPNGDRVLPLLPTLGPAAVRRSEAIFEIFYMEHFLITKNILKKLVVRPLRHKKFHLKQLDHK